MKKLVVLSITGVAILAVVAVGFYVVVKRGGDEATIKNGSLVRLEYTLSDEKGTLIESNKGKEPLSYTQGQGQIIPGLEKALSGMSVNEQKSVRVKPEDAYGALDAKAFHEIPRAEIPADALKVGNTLLAKDPQGQLFPVRVHEIKDKTVVLDFNHPLAGKTLSFAVKILEVRAPQKP